MPTYEYACKSCGEHLEAVQSFTDPALTSCPRCGGELRKVFGAVGIVFKGSGFYKTDSRSSTTATSPAKTEHADSSGGSSEPPPASATTESGAKTTPTSTPAPVGGPAPAGKPTPSPAASTTAASA